VHPFNFTSPNFTGDWDVYLRQQCNQEDGYRGLFCGTCIKGYGMTAPFQCKKCAGAKATVEKNGTATVSHDRGAISGLWVFYWVALTGWYVFTVWTVMRAKPDAGKSSPTPMDGEVLPARLYGRSATWPRSAKLEGTEVKGETPQYDEAGLLDIAKVRGLCRPHHAMCTHCVSCSQ